MISQLIILRNLINELDILRQNIAILRLRLNRLDRLSIQFRDLNDEICNFEFEMLCLLTDIEKIQSELKIELFPIPD